MRRKQYKGTNTFDVFLVVSRSGFPEHRAYQVVNGQRKRNPPKTLEKHYIGRVKCRYPIDAIRAAISNTTGDDSDQAADEMKESRNEYGAGYMQQRGAS